MKKLTITDLLKNKEQYKVKSDIKEEVFIERLDSTITIKKPERSLCMEAVQLTKDDNGTTADIFLVYNVVVEPNLKDKNLLKEFGCVEPTDIVEKIFEAGEIMQISQVALELSGYNSGVKRVKDIKN